MTNLTSKTLFRTIRSTLGRYLAILGIIALGVGFFTGLKNAQPSMRTTADVYLTDRNIYDFRLVSSLGFDEDDLAAFAEADGIRAAEGSYVLEASAAAEGKSTFVYQLFSLPETIALPKLTAGRTAQNAGECVADSSAFAEEDIGKKITLSAENSADTLAQLSQTEYTIVGLAQSPRFISSNRGNTSIGSGEIAGFLYLPSDAFRSDFYHEILLAGEINAMLFSQEYAAAVSMLTPKLESVLGERVRIRYNRLTAADADAFPEPTAYALTLESNPGYAAFLNDTSIVDGIANAFPAFFVLIAALVCITTMTRMVDEERTQIGTLKAMGCPDFVISRKYLLYASSAALLGCVGGFFLGAAMIPRIIWAVYAVSYDFADLAYYFDPLMSACCLCVSVIGSVAATLSACGKELREKPSELIRPKPPGRGGRIVLERMTFMWKRLSFLWKSTLRNAFRYKKRMIMMITGIAGCTALIVTGFGLKDSVANILDYQYEEILLYDAAAAFEAGEKTEQAIRTLLAQSPVQYEFAYRKNLSVRSDKSEKEATVIASPSETADQYFHLYNAKGKIAYPEGNEAVISAKLAGLLGVTTGDVLFVSFGGGDIRLTVAGVCENFLNHYVYVPTDAVPDYRNNTAYLLAQNAGISQTAARLYGIPGVNHVTVSAKERADMEQTMSSINYIVLLVILCAGALAFIVLYNLTNINIMERIREVATIKVLGFRSAETSSYVLNENILLSVLGAFCGLALGKLLHWYVVLQIQVDSMTFDIRISPLSYLISFGCTVLFALISNFIMRFKLEKIHMAESLKAVE